MLFKNFKHAYDSISRKKFYDAMESFGIPNKLKTDEDDLLMITNSRIIIEEIVSNYR